MVCLITANLFAKIPQISPSANLMRYHSRTVDSIQNPLFDINAPIITNTVMLDNYGLSYRLDVSQ